MATIVVDGALRALSRHRGLLFLGPRGSVGGISSVITITTANQAVGVWDQEVMNTYQGFPSFVGYDQARGDTVSGPRRRPRWSPCLDRCS